MGRKFGGFPPLWRGAGYPSNTKSPGPKPTSIPSGMWIRPCSHVATTDMGRKLGAVPLWGGGPGSPSNTMWPGPRPIVILFFCAIQILLLTYLLTYLLTCTPSFILIRPTVWPQYTNVTYKQDRADRQRSDSMGRTDLQTVAQKMHKCCTMLHLFTNNEKDRKF